MEFEDASDEAYVTETILVDENGKQKSVWDQQWCWFDKTIRRRLRHHSRPLQKLKTFIFLESLGDWKLRVGAMAHGELLKG